MAAKSKRGLGRGLDALIPSTPASPKVTQGATEVPVASIRPNPHQPRNRLDPGQLEELASSIREHGVIQPLIVTANTRPNTYIMIAGERRLEASKRAGLTKVPVIIRGETSDQALLELALIENVQRADLGPLEQASAYQHLVDDFGLSHSEVARQVGKSRTAITNTLRLLKLPAKIQQALALGKISEGHARPLLSNGLSAAAQMQVFEAILRKDLSVRATEKLVRQLQGKTPKQPAPPKPTDPDGEALADRLSEFFETRVKLRRGRKGGTITLSFFSDEELNAIVDKMMAEPDDG